MGTELVQTPQCSACGRASAGPACLWGAHLPPRRPPEAGARPCVSISIRCSATPAEWGRSHSSRDLTAWPGLHGQPGRSRRLQSDGLSPRPAECHQLSPPGLCRSRSPPCFPLQAHCPRCTRRVWVQLAPPWALTGVSQLCPLLHRDLSILAAPLGAEAVRTARGAAPSRGSKRSARDAGTACGARRPWCVSRPAGRQTWGRAVATAHSNRFPAAALSVHGSRRTTGDSLRTAPAQ